MDFELTINMQSLTEFECTKHVTLRKLQLHKAHKHQGNKHVNQAKYTQLQYPVSSIWQRSV